MIAVDGTDQPVALADMAAAHASVTLLERLADKRHPDFSDGRLR
ncbi:hypothetical protein [Streptomyces sp. NPDC059850]